MARFETDFEVIKNESGEVCGFSLVAQPQFEAEVFCSTFPKALLDGKSDIKFEGNEIVFVHPNCDFSGRCAHKLDAADIAALQELLSGKHRLKLERAGFFTPGFKIVSA